MNESKDETLQFQVGTKATWFMGDRFNISHGSRGPNIYLEDKRQNCTQNHAARSHGQKGCPCLWQGAKMK